MARLRDFLHPFVNKLYIFVQRVEPQAHLPAQPFAHQMTLST